MGSASTGDSAFAVWPDGRGGFADVFLAEIKGKPHGHGGHGDD